MNNKAFLIGNEIYLIGGNENYNFEIYSLNLQKSFFLPSFGYE